MWCVLISVRKIKSVGRDGGGGRSAYHSLHAATLRGIVVCMTEQSNWLNIKQI